MAEPPDQMPATAGRGYLRASHADREQVIDKLKAAFVQGRLTKAELDARVGQAFVARTYADLAALTVDVPAGLADAVPSRAVPAQARPPMGNAAKTGICVVIAVVVAVIVSIPTGGMALFVFAPFYFVALLVAGAQMLANRHDKRSQGQLPPGRASGAGGETPQRTPPASPGGQLPPGEGGHWHTADAVPIVRPRLQPS
jgi:hypothetical protein